MSLAMSRYWAPCSLIVWIVLPQIYAYIEQYSPEYLKGSSADFQILSPCNFTLSSILFCKLLLLWSRQTFNFVFSTLESIRVFFSCTLASLLSHGTIWGNFRAHIIFCVYFVFACLLFVRDHCSSLPNVQ